MLVIKTKLNELFILNYVKLQMNALILEFLSMNALFQWIKMENFNGIEEVYRMKPDLD